MSPEKTSGLEPVDLDNLEGRMLNAPQVDCLVTHSFGGGLYVRKMELPPNVLVIGHVHKQEHVCILLSGELTVRTSDEECTVLNGPYIFISPPGRKALYSRTGATICNAYPNPTDERNIDKLDVLFVDHSNAWKAKRKKDESRPIIASDHSINDFDRMLVDVGISKAEMREISDNTENTVDMPKVFVSEYLLRRSPIQGQGVFIPTSKLPFAIIGPAVLFGKKTPLGRFTNHSGDPNAFMHTLENGDVWLVTRCPVLGCQGGRIGEEITVDYRISRCNSLGNEVMS